MVSGRYMIFDVTVDANAAVLRASLDGAVVGDVRTCGCRVGLDLSAQVPPVGAGKLLEQLLHLLGAGATKGGIVFLPSGAIAVTGDVDFGAGIGAGLADDFVEPAPQHGVSPQGRFRGGQVDAEVRDQQAAVGGPDDVGWQMPLGGSGPLDLAPLIGRALGGLRGLSSFELHRGWFRTAQSRLRTRPIRFHTRRAPARTRMLPVR